MKRVCAWCNKNMGEKPPYEDTSETHGMCDECLESEMKKQDECSRRWLEKRGYIIQGPMGLTERTAGR